MRFSLIVWVLLLAPPSYALSQPDMDCFREQTGSIPPPTHDGSVLNVRANPRFYLGLGEAANLRLEPTPQDPEFPEEAVALTLDSGALVINNQTLRRFRPETELELGRCYVMELANIDLEWSAETVYSQQLICATEPASELEEPPAPTLDVTSRRPRYGQSGGSNDDMMVERSFCGSSLVGAKDNVTVNASGLGNDLAILHIALKSGDELLEEKVAVLSKQQVERHGQTQVGFNHPDTAGLSVHAWIENLDGALGPVTVNEVPAPSGCTTGTITPWMMVLLLGLRRRLRG
jgi:hypothetical protein